MVQAVLCATIQTCVAQYGPILIQTTPSTTGSARVVPYAAQCGSFMPQYIEIAPAHIQALPKAFPEVLWATAQELIQTLPTMAAGSPAAGPSFPPVESAPMLVQGTPFPAAYMASPNWHMFMPNLLPQALLAPLTDSDLHGGTVFQIIAFLLLCLVSISGQKLYCLYCGYLYIAIY